MVSQREGIYRSGLHIVKVDSLGVELWSDHTAALGGVHQVPQTYAPVSTSSKDHRAVINDACAQRSDCFLLSGLKGEGELEVK